MECSPKNKGPIGTMPKTTYQKYNGNISNRFQFCYPRASKRYVYIMSEPGGQRYVPALPIFGHVSREIGEFKIGHQFDAKQFGRTNGNIRIPTKITIHLKTE